MEQNLELARIKGIIKRRRGWLIGPFCAVVFVVSAIAFLLPDIFRSSATIMIQTPQIPSNLVPSTVTSYADQRIQTITQEVTSRTKILKLVEKYDLLPEKREKLPAEDLVEKVKGRISVEPIDAEIKKETQNKPVALTIAFKLSYEDNDPRKSQLVANEISSYFMGKNLEAREKYARNTSEFLEEQLKQAKVRVEELEGRLASYRQAHLEELPDFTNLNMQKLERLNSDISNINMQIRSLEEQRSAIKGRVALLDPFAGSSERVLTLQEREQQAHLERTALVAKYSEKHPVVQAKNQEIALLQGGDGTDKARAVQLREKLQQLELALADLKARYTEKHPQVRGKMEEIGGVRRELQLLGTGGGGAKKPSLDNATSPAYIALRADMEKAEASINSLKAEKDHLEDQIGRVYATLHAMPDVAKQYNELTTDYQNSKAYVTELQQKLHAAQLSQGMEEEQLGEAFEVVEPAFLPEKPVKPNRLAIVLIGVVLGLGFSIGLASVVEFSDPRIHDMQTLQELAGMPVFAAIPRILTEEDRRRARRKRVFLAAGAVGSLVVLVLLFHFFVMDAYVFYAKLMRLLERKLPM